MPDLASVDGRVTPLERATVRVQDRGFLLADGVYEVMRAYAGRVFRLQEHLARLDASLRGIRLRAPLSDAALGRRITALLRRSTYREARIYVQITRGAGPRQHAFPTGRRPTVVVTVEAVRSNPALAARGVRAITLPDPRWRSCHLKTVALLPNVLAKQQALDAGAYEALFIGPRGEVREAATANVFAVQGDTLWTHPLGPEILPGVSRAVVLELARAAGLRVREARFRRAGLVAADEVFLSSTMQEVLPVVRIDGRPVGRGRPGPVTRDLQRRFQAQVCAATAPESHHAAPSRRRPRGGS